MDVVTFIDPIDGGTMFMRVRGAATLSSDSPKKTLLQTLRFQHRGATDTEHVAGEISSGVDNLFSSVLPCRRGSIYPRVSVSTCPSAGHSFVRLSGEQRRTVSSLLLLHYSSCASSLKQKC